MQPADFLRARRSASPKLLTTPAPAGRVLDDILALAIRTPDHGRLFPWRFVVLAGAGLANLAAAVGDAFAADHPEADADHPRPRGPEGCDSHPGEHVREQGQPRSVVLR